MRGLPTRRSPHETDTCYDGEGQYTRPEREDPAERAVPEETRRSDGKNHDDHDGCGGSHDENHSAGAAGPFRLRMRLLRLEG